MKSERTRNYFETTSGRELAAPDLAARLEEVRDPVRLVMADVAGEHIVSGDGKQTGFSV